MAATTITFIFLAFACHVALVMGSYAGPMAKQDKAVLEVVKAALVNKTDFPAIACYDAGDLSNGWALTAFTCDDAGRVFSINVANQKRGGSISPAIGNLTALRFLLLSGNNLTGMIPSSIGQLTSLILLYMNDNQLSGSIPSSIGQLSDLLQLNLSFNKLSGSIPSSIGQLKILELANLGHNQLSGIIPSSIDQMPSLLVLDITYNYFTEPVTSGKLGCLDFEYNCLFGSSLPTRCSSASQRPITECKAFCNATQPGGPCGGAGICSNGTNGPSCACNKGYNNLANKFTCKLAKLPPPPPKSPPPRRSPPPSPRPKSPPPRRSPPPSPRPKSPPPRRSPPPSPRPKSPPPRRAPPPKRA